MEIITEKFEYTLCLNGIGKFSNIFWQEGVITKIQTRKLKLIYDYNFISEDDRKILDRINETAVEVEKVDFKDGNLNEFQNIFICDTVDNIEELKFIKKFPIKGCFYGGLGKINYLEQIKLLKKHNINKIVSDILPEELLSLGFYFPIELLDLIEFWEPQLPSLNHSHYNKKNKNFLVIKCNYELDFVGNLVSKIIKGLDSVSFIDIRNTCKKLNTEDLLLPKNCKKIILIGKNPLLYHHFALLSTKESIEFTTYNNNSTSILRHLNLPYWYINNLYNVDIQETEKSLRRKIKETFLEINSTNYAKEKPDLSLSNDSSFTDRILTLYTKLTVLTSNETKILNDINYFLFENHKKNSTHMFSMLFFQENILREYLSDTHKISICTFFIGIISKKELNQTYIFILHKIFSIEPNIFLQSLENNIRYLGSNLNYITAALYIVITSFDYTQKIRELALNFLLRNVKNPVVIGRLYFAIDDYDNFNSHNLRNDVTDSHQILSTSINHCLGFKSHTDKELIKKYIQLLRLSKPSRSSYLPSCLAETKLLILKGESEEAFNVFNNYFNSNECNISFSHIFDIIIYALTQGFHKSARQYFSLTNPIQNNIHEKLGCFCFQILLYGENDSKIHSSLFDNLNDKILENNTLFSYLFYKIIFALSNNRSGEKRIDLIIKNYSNNFLSTIEEITTPLKTRYAEDSSINKISNKIYEILNLGNH
jgi:hypothetical protein